MQAEQVEERTQARLNERSGGSATVQEEVMS